MDWVAKLSGYDHHLELLAENFSDDPRIFERDGDFYFESTELASCHEVRGLRRIAEEQLNIIIGVRLFEIESARDLFVEEVGTLGPDGFRAQSAHAGPITVPGPLPDHIQTMSNFKNVNDYRRLAEEDSIVQDLMNLLLRGTDWVNLYRIFEFIQDHPIDDESVVSKGWVSDSEKDLFKRTANSRGAIGDNARHGSESIPSPENPMDNNEASKIIGKLARSWLNERFEHQSDKE